MRVPVLAAPLAAIVVVTVAAPAVEARKPVTVPAMAVGAPMKPSTEPTPAAMAGAASPPVTANSAPPPRAAAPTCVCGGGQTKGWGLTAMLPLRGCPP
jgi:hypothetical protein